MRTRGLRYALLAGLCGFGPCAVPGAEITHHTDAATGLESWTATGEPFSVQLVQMLADRVRAGYAARELPQALIDGVTDHCVFGTIVRNESDAPLSYDVAHWRYVTPDGKSHPVKTKSQWVAEWQDMDVAFKWSMLNDAPTFHPGDWIQGYTTIGLSPGDAFDLEYTWSQHGKTHTVTIPHVRCAPADAPGP